MFSLSHLCLLEFWCFLKFDFCFWSLYCITFTYSLTARVWLGRCMTVLFRQFTKLMLFHLNYSKSIFWLIDELDSNTTCSHVTEYAGDCWSCSLINAVIFLFINICFISFVFDSIRSLSLIFIYLRL